MALVTLENKGDKLYKYLEIKKIDYVFMEEDTKLLKVMNFFLRITDILEEEVTLVERYKEYRYNS